MKDIRKKLEQFYDIYERKDNNGWIYYSFEDKSFQHKYSQKNLENFFYIVFIDKNQKKCIKIHTWYVSLTDTKKHCFWIASNFMNLNENNLEVYIEYNYFSKKDKQISYSLSKEDIKQYIETLKNNKI